MFILLLFAFIAGIVTVLSPCILPVLPIVLSSSLGGHTNPRRPVGVVIGFIGSFTFFTLFLSLIVQATGVSADALRFLSIVVIALFGVSLLVPQFQVLLELLASKLTSKVSQNNTRGGLGGGILLGISLGLLWTPCVGPILAAVISLAISGTVTFSAALITLSYALGTAIPLFFIMRGGQSFTRNNRWLVTKAALIQKVFGVIMILTALAIYFNVDRTFQTYILTTFPQYGTGLTSLEDNKLVENSLNALKGNESPYTDLLIKDDRPVLQPKELLAPELIPGGEWFNSDPLTLQSLRGKVVIIDFWTYSCINCQRTFPYLRDWWTEYEDDGLVIIGVHAPEFEFEKDPDNVAQAIKDFELTYPIVQDNAFATWRAYNNQYWPAKYFIDKDGYIRYWHFGEGKYDESERVIQELLKEAGATNINEDVNNVTYETYSQTPEIYLGYGRIENFSSPENITQNAAQTYTRPVHIMRNKLAYDGEWTITKEYSKPSAGSTLHMRFHAKEVFLVMRPTGDLANVRVEVDGVVQYFGKDTTGGVVTVNKDTLYHIISLPEPGEHTLELIFDAGEIELFAFTFG
ncbi:MAG: cytochrome c biogenesis protein DipZ [bacterium]|nr:cytochrome c biogenesis protein DipZ [bacterium]